MCYQTHCQFNNKRRRLDDPEISFLFVTFYYVLYSFDTDPVRAELTTSFSTTDYITSFHYDSCRFHCQVTFVNTRNCLSFDTVCLPTSLPASAMYTSHFSATLRMYYNFLPDDKLFYSNCLGCICTFCPRIHSVYILSLIHI